MAVQTSRILDIATAVTPHITPVEHHGDLTIVVPVEHLIDVLTELRDHPETSFSMLVDITAIDWAKGERDSMWSTFWLLSSTRHVCA